MIEEKKETMDDVVDALLKTTGLYHLTLEVKKVPFGGNKKAFLNNKAGKITDEIMDKADSKKYCGSREIFRSMVYNTIIKYLK